MAEGPFSATVIFPETEIVESVIMTAGGPPGPAGAAATISVGTTTTGVAGSNATVANIGTATEAIFEFTIPRGATGAAGTGVPAGGTATQALTKIDSTDFNTHWVSIPSADTVSARLVSVSAELMSQLQSTSAALSVADAALSARITSAEAAAGVSVTSAKVQTASAAATSADAHANAVSARVVSVSAELVSQIAIASALASTANAHANTASAAAVSADSHANLVSIRLTSASGELASLIQVASAAATSVLAHSDSVSARAVSVSNELASLLASGDAALSTRVDTASALAAAADSHANVVSARAVSISAELASLIASGDNALSARIVSVGGGAGTVTHSAGPLTSNHVVLGADGGDTKTAVGIATDGDSVIVLGSNGTVAGVKIYNASNWATTLVNSTNTNTYTTTLPGATTTLVGTDTTDILTNKTILSPTVGDVSHQGITFKNATNWPTVLVPSSNTTSSTITLPGTTTTLVGTNTTDTISARVVSVSSELVSLMASADAALSARITSAEGVGGGTASITSAEFFSNLQGYSTIATAAGTTSISSASPPEIFFTGSTTQTFQLPVVSTLVLGRQYLVKNDSSGVVTVQSSGANSIVAMAAGTTAVFTVISTSGTGTASWSYSYSNTASDVVSARLVSVSAELASVIASGEAFLSARITSAEAITPSTSVTSAKVQTASAAATSADAHANTVSARAVSISAELASLVQIASAAATSADAHANTVSTRAVSISAELASLVQVASAAATSADAHANTVSARAVSISNELGSLLASASLALETHINTVSARVVSVSNELGSLLASTSAQLRADITSVAGLAGGTASITSAEFFSNVQGYSTIATAAGTTSISAGSPPEIFFTGSTTQTFQLPVVSTLVLGKQYLVKNDSSGIVTVQSSGANSIVAMAGGSTAVFTCIAITGTGTASWSYSYSNTASDVVSARVVSVSAELASLLLSAAPRKAINTAAQTSITVSTCSTVSGVSLIVSSGVTYTFQFQIPFTTGQAVGMHVGVLSPAANQFFCHFNIPGAVGNTAVQPAANGVTPYQAEVRAVATRVSTSLITLTGTTLMVDAWGTINPSATGSLKFQIGPGNSNVTANGVIVLQGANIMVWRMSG